MKRWLYVLMFLVVFLGGCTDVDMSGFNHIGFTMQHPSAPRPASPQPEEKPIAQLAQCRHHPPCPTP